MENELLIRKRLIDLSKLANRRGIVTFSDFLNLNELNLFHQVLADIKTAYQLSGGYEFAERQMIAFIPDALSYAKDASVCFPIVCLHFYPEHLKFAEKLSHRDILGALMNLGIERSRIGDIKLEEYNYYVFCEENISEFLLQTLRKIRHTAVSGEKMETEKWCFEQKFEQMDGVVASARLDNITAFLTKKSRNQSVLLIHAQKVFVNDRMIISKAYDCKPGDLISIRGFGKYIFEECGGETRKGRIKVSIKKYV